MNWFGVLAHHAARTPDKAITVFEGEVLTYGEMEARARALAGGLQRAGSDAATWSACSRTTVPEFLQTMFAANCLGAIAMPINWRLAAPEVRYILEHSEARALVCDEALLDVADQATAGAEDAIVRSCIAATRRTGMERHWPSSRPTAAPASRFRPSPTTSTASCTPRAPRAAPRA